MTQTRIGIAILAAGLLGIPAAALAQPTPEEAEPAEPGAPEGEPAEEPAPPPEEAPALVSEPEPVEADVEEAEHASFGYDKGFYISHDNDKGSFKLKIGARVQSLLSVTSADTGLSTRQDRWAFSINRARLVLSGHAFTKKLEYKFQTDFGKGFVTLKDFYLDAQLADEVWLRAGQWKRPFSRQQINSSGNLELVDRAITDKQFNAGRDIGVAVHNGYEDSPELEWAAGVWNGTGEKPVFSGEVDPVDGSVDGGGFSNVPKDFLPVFVGRVGLNRGGLKGYSEADLEGGALRWGAAASVWVEGDFDGGDPPEHQAQLDAVLKLNGLSFSAAGYVQTVESDWAAIGTHAQIGKVFGEGTRRMNGALRYAMVNPRGGGLDDATHELVVGWGWLPHKHNAKLQLDLGSVIAPDGDFADHLVARLQGQLSF